MIDVIKEESLIKAKVLIILNNAKGRSLMKKRLVCLALAATMTASMAVSAFAASTEVETAYSAYNAMLEAIADADVAAMADTTVAYLESYNELDEAENEELCAMFDGETEEVAMEMLANYIFACSIVESGEVYDAFVNEKNVVNAKKLIDMYDNIKEDEDFVATLQDCFSDFEAVYNEAVAITEENAGYDIYVLYMDLLDAMESGAEEEISAAVEAFVDPFNEISEEQLVGIGEILGLDGDAAASEMLYDYITANVYLEFCKALTDFSDNCSGETAKAFVEYYDSIYNDPEYENEDLEKLIDDHFTGYEETYEEAKKWAEAQDIVDLYTDVVTGLENRDLASVKDILDEFASVLEVMDEDKWEVVAQISDGDVEELAMDVVYNYVTANVLVSIEDAFNAYLEEQNEDTAKALVEIYDSVYNDESYEDEYLREIVPEFFEGIDEKYAEATELLAGESGAEDETTVEETEKETETEKTTEKETSKDTAPGTGDAATALPFLGMLAAGACVVAGKKKEEKA